MATTEEIAKAKKSARQNLPVNLKPIANAAGQFGVIIHVNGTHTVLKAKPDLKRLQKAVGGYIELIGVPNGNEVSNKSVLVVNEEGLLKDLLPNATASYIAMQHLVGPVVWLPKEFIK